MYLTMYGAYGNGSTMDKVVCRNVVFETDETKDGGERWMYLMLLMVRAVRGKMEA